jgi:hypothetical protein
MSKHSARNLLPSIAYAILPLSGLRCEIAPGPVPGAGLAAEEGGSSTTRTSYYPDRRE